MGGDISVFREGELEESFWKHHGAKDETLYDLLTKGVSSLLKMTASSRMIYDTSELSDNFDVANTDISWSCDEFRLSLPPMPNESEPPLHSESILSIACCMWTICKKNYGKKSVQNLCIVYLHTNSRNLADATELIPLCEQLGISLFSFDWPGCGKSDGSYYFPSANILRKVLNYLIGNGGSTKYVLWARGTGTAAALELLGSSSVPEEISCAVLDTPFTCLRDVIRHYTNQLSYKSFITPYFFFSFYGEIVRKQVMEKTGTVYFDFPVDCPIEN